MAGATREPAWAGPGATRGVATALEAAPNTRLGRDSRREIAGGPAPSTPSGHLARGITCPPPGVNRDPPAQGKEGGAMVFSVKQVLLDEAISQENVHSNVNELPSRARGRSAALTARSRPVRHLAGGPARRKRAG